MSSCSRDQYDGTGSLWLSWLNYTSYHLLVYVLPRHIPWSLCGAIWLLVERACLFFHLYFIMCSLIVFRRAHQSSLCFNNIFSIYFLCASFLSKERSTSNCPSCSDASLVLRQPTLRSCCIGVGKIRSWRAAINPISEEWAYNVGSLHLKLQSSDQWLCFVGTVWWQPWLGPPFNLETQIFRLSWCQ